MKWGCSAGVATPAWQTRRYVVRATGNDTLGFTENGGNDGSGALIDAVKLLGGVINDGGVVTQDATVPA